MRGGHSSPIQQNDVTYLSLTIFYLKVQVLFAAFNKFLISMYQHISKLHSKSTLHIRFQKKDQDL